MDYVHPGRWRLQMQKKIYSLKRNRKIDIIKHHMFPLTSLLLPKDPREGVLVKVLRGQNFVPRMETFKMERSAPFS